MNFKYAKFLYQSIDTRQQCHNHYFQQWNTLKSILRRTGILNSVKIEMALI